ncbi:SIR2 family protein [Rhizobium sp. YJ-22]|uniref:SIR2 family protein n=1 Tax=Rhizobium sp. YJ-22 TaxID=3037556 RepID=UPI0024122E54|nr:SIR2 family protein [Rhizobium sp. YJ-22]MDG3578970.1 SIR2 family protein [Rhizobium sp. YJ-22]
MAGLDGVLSKLLENLCLRITGADCEHHRAFDAILGLADLSADERAQIDLARPVASWPIHAALIDRLWNKYSKALGTEVQDRPFDYLLWDVLDFATTFAVQRADAEHLAIGMLVLEGVVSDLATANWDGLLEAAMVELGRPNETFLVAVTGGDLHGPPGIGRSYKFHGCANRAIANEAEYRPLLVAREAAITHWALNPRFTQMREQLRALIARSRTLMIGLSRQDTNIQQLFSANGCAWNSAPPPIVFAAQELSEGQKLSSRVRTRVTMRPTVTRFGQMPPCLPSETHCCWLLLRTMFSKLAALAGLLTSPAVGATGKQSLVDGLKALEGAAARAGNANRYDCARTIAALIGRVSEQFLGRPGSAGRRPYEPLSAQPAHLMQQDPAAEFSARPEAAAALGLIGQGLVASGRLRWTIRSSRRAGHCDLSPRRPRPACFSPPMTIISTSSSRPGHLTRQTTTLSSSARARSLPGNSEAHPSPGGQARRRRAMLTSASYSSSASFDEVQSRFNSEVGL